MLCKGRTVATRCAVLASNLQYNRRRVVRRNENAGTLGKAGSASGKKGIGWCCVDGWNGGLCRATEGSGAWPLTWVTSGNGNHAFASDASIGRASREGLSHHQ